MKSVIFYSLLASLSLSGLNAYAQGTCQAGGGQFPGVGAPSPYVANGGYPTAGDVQQFLSQAPATAAAPQARITVVDPTESNAANSANATSSISSARITVVSEEFVSASKPVVADGGPIAEALQGLVGNWTAVARYGDNELSTVELQLDDRGWATFTVPGADGKPKTIKRRVELKNDEIKLTGEGQETLLGKLVSVNSRQMVLEKAGGQVTFVRI